VQIFVPQNFPVILAGVTEVSPSNDELAQGFGDSLPPLSGLRVAVHPRVAALPTPIHSVSAASQFPT
jgi:hypothetical protein